MRAQCDNLYLRRFLRTNPIAVTLAISRSSNFALLAQSRTTSILNRSSVAPHISMARGLAEIMSYFAKDLLHNVQTS